MIFLVMTFSFLQKNTSHDSPLSTFVSPLGTIMNLTTNNAGLEERILPLLENEEGVYAIVIENLNTGETYTLNEDRQFASASLYKLWVMGAVYQEIDEGTLTKQTVMSDEIAKINERFNIATESAEKKGGEIAMTVEKALFDMITISDNYSALLLSQTVRLSNVKAFMEEYGYSNSHLDPPTTTARDIAAFYGQLYNREIINEDMSTEMMALLAEQTWNDRIPKFLPEGTVIAHKTGELDKVKHDAGIVFTDNGDYVIVLLSETNSQQNAAEVHAQISEAVYKYFTN